MPSQQASGHLGGSGGDEKKKKKKKKKKPRSVLQQVVAAGCACLRRAPPPPPHSPNKSSATILSATQNTNVYLQTSVCLEPHGRRGAAQQLHPHAQVYRQRTQQRHPGTGRMSSVSSYSASSLDEPAPAWSAYHPQDGVAWSPSSTHHYHEGEDARPPGGAGSKLKFFTFDSTTSLSTSTSVDKSFTHSLPYLLPTPTVQRVHIQNYNGAMSSVRISSPPLVRQLLPTNANRQCVKMDQCDGTLRNGDIRRSVNSSNISDKLESDKSIMKQFDNGSRANLGRVHFTKLESPNIVPDSGVDSLEHVPNDINHNVPQSRNDISQRDFRNNEITDQQNNVRNREIQKSKWPLLESLSLDDIDFFHEAVIDEDVSQFDYQPEAFREVRRNINFSRKTYSTLSAMLDWDVETASITSSDLGAASPRAGTDLTRPESRVTSFTHSLGDLTACDPSTLSPPWSRVGEDPAGQPLQHFLATTDLSPVLIQRQRLTTGRLMLKGREYSVVSGCIKSLNPQYPAYVKPVTIQIFRDVNSEEDMINFFRNVLQLKTLRHKNLLEIVGMCVNGSPGIGAGHEVLLVSERTHGKVSLQRLLDWNRENHPERRCGAHVALKWSLEVVDALLFLAARGVVHTNLTASTVMLDRHCCVRLACVEPHPVTTRAPAARWIAPESHHHGRYTHSSTVWSVGVLLWSMLSSGEKPYAHLRAHHVFEHLSAGRRLPPPPDCPPRLYHVLHACWHTRPRLRPGLPTLARVLAALRACVPAAPHPGELFPDTDDFWDIVQQHTEEENVHK